MFASEDVRPGLYQAARLSLGALGIITAITFRCVPAYNLHERVWFEGPDASMAKLCERIEATRHYEFFWYPFRDLFEHKSLALTNAPPDPLPDRKRERIGHSHRVFPSVRDHRFNEMEYALPAECGPACFADIRGLFHERHPEAQWPVEYRTVAGDDVWLSPDYGRATVTISVHEDAARPYGAAVRRLRSGVPRLRRPAALGQDPRRAPRPTSRPSTSTGTTSGGCAPSSIPRAASSTTTSAPSAASRLSPSSHRQRPIRTRSNRLDRRSS